ncbi:TetR/AcrR family transcriptional regulator [Gemmatimonadota bacterium]
MVPQPSPRIGKAERTRAAILDAALGFLWSRPFREMTVSKLMESTGASRSAFYQYFSGLHDLMQALQDMLQDEIFTAAEPWIAGTGDPISLLHETMAGLVRVCHERGPFMRALSDAAATDKVFGEAWRQFLGAFDDAASVRIEADQQQGLIPDFDPRPVAFALNRLDASTLIDAFGQHPRMDPEPVREALARIWISTLYGTEWLDSRSSNLVRT